MIEFIQSKINLESNSLIVKPEIPGLDCILEIEVKDVNNGASLEPAPVPVIVGSQCGAAVLRGAEVFAPGILGCPASLKPDQDVSVFCDLHNKTLKGTVIKIVEDDDDLLFIGNGLAKLSRSDLFKQNSQHSCGVAIEMTKCIYPCPRISDTILSQKSGN